MQYDLAEFALKMVAPNNKLIYDDKGIPSVMVYVPKFKMSDVIDGAGDSTHSAFIVKKYRESGSANSRTLQIMAVRTPCLARIRL